MKGFCPPTMTVGLSSSVYISDHNFSSRLSMIIVFIIYTRLNANKNQ